MAIGPHDLARWESAENGALRFVVRGDLDLSVLDRLVEAMWTRAPGSVPRVEIDLGAVGFFDTSVARTLERYRLEASERDADVRVVVASPVPLMVLRLTGMSKLLGVD